MKRQKQRNRIKNCACVKFCDRKNLLSAAFLMELGLRQKKKNEKMRTYGL